MALRQVDARNDNLVNVGCPSPRQNIITIDVKLHQIKMTMAIDKTDYTRFDHFATNIIQKPDKAY